MATIKEREIAGFSDCNRRIRLGLKIQFGCLEENVERRIVVQLFASSNRPGIYVLLLLHLKDLEASPKTFDTLNLRTQAYLSALLYGIALFEPPTLPLLKPLSI